MNAHFSFPLREVGGQKWCSLSNMGIKRIDVVAFTADIKSQHTFAGGHRHRLVVFRDDIHILFPTAEISVDIAAVKPTAGPPKRRHSKQR